MGELIWFIEAIDTSGETNAMASVKKIPLDILIFPVFTIRILIL